MYCFFRKLNSDLNIFDKFPQRIGVHQPREYNWGAAWKKKVAAAGWKSENTSVGIRHADYVAPSIRKNW
jgi:hypothetical protein